MMKLGKRVMLDGFWAGERVQAHPATDRWMMGDRFGTVTAVGRKLIAVKMDRSGRTLKFAPANLLHAE